MRIESSVSASAVAPDLVNGAAAEVGVVSQEVQAREFPAPEVGGGLGLDHVERHAQADLPVNGVNALAASAPG